MILSYRYKLLPLKRQHRALERLRESQRELYNAAMEECIGCYLKTGKTLTYIDQTKALTTCRRDLADMSGVPVYLQRWTLKRLDYAFRGFFQRLKTKNGKAGFPRFRSEGAWDSFGFEEFRGIRFDGKRLRFKGMPGGLRVRVHKRLPELADIRSCVLRRDATGSWYVCFDAEVLTASSHPVSNAVGVDLGLNVFAYCSDGIVVQNPRIARKRAGALRVSKRAWARTKVGSHGRAKARERVARVHRKIANTRTTWLHQQSSALVKRADLVVVEALNARGMLHRHTLARSIVDASWATFVSMLDYKAEKAGGCLIRVDPRNTSQKCSGCGELVPKSLSVRVHSCPHCGLVIDRDYNASLNILKAGIGLGAHNVAGLTASVRPETRTASLVRKSTLDETAQLNAGGVA